MKYLFILLLLGCLSARAQTDPELENYLVSHRYTIKQASDSSTDFPDNQIPALLEKRMQGKLLFVYGDGFSHLLHLNAYLCQMFQRYFITRGMKYFFNEAARSWTVRDRIFLSTPSITVDSFYDWPFARRYYKAEREIYQQGNYQLYGIDFERRDAFKSTLTLLESMVPANGRGQLYQLAPYFNDTSYVNLSRKKFVKFYREQRDRFFADSNKYKALMGNVYGEFRYLISDIEPSTYYNNRNRNMASHLLDAIKRDPGQMYFLNLGTAHTRRKRDGLQKTTVGILDESEELKGKILVTHLYCENCAAEANEFGTGDNSWSDYMKGTVLRSFQQAANSTIVLFDLTELPEKYAYIRKDYNDFLVFARDQH